MLLTQAASRPKPIPSDTSEPPASTCPMTRAAPPSPSAITPSSTGNTVNGISGVGLDGLNDPTDVIEDPRTGNLYVSDDGCFELGWPGCETANRVQKRDVQGHWSFTNQDEAVGQFFLLGNLGHHIGSFSGRVGMTSRVAVIVSAVRKCG